MCCVLCSYIVLQAMFTSIPQRELYSGLQYNTRIKASVEFEKSNCGFRSDIH